MAEINESIDSNIEVKMNDPSPPSSSTTTTTTTISINDSAVTINNAKRIISTHLETSTTLINFKNLDDIINLLFCFVHLFFHPMYAAICATLYQLIQNQRNAHVPLFDPS